MPLNITLNQPQNDNIGSQLMVLVEAMKIIEKYKTDKEITFDFSKISFVHPVFITSVSSLMSYLSENGYNVYHCCINGSYLQTMCFPLGLKPDELPRWEEMLDNYKGKNYLPVINLPTSRKNQETEIRENLLSKINTLLEINLNLNANYKSAVSYLISEMTDNIVDHSGVSRGWLSAQYYPSKKFLDVCIIDTGKTILGSYAEKGVNDIKNDIIAIEKATSGLSTKDKERGYGIRTTKAMIEEGLKGKFILISGRAILSNNQLTEFPVKWNGTILALRIPQNVANFHYSDFLK